jgi:hypothetical protein
VQGAKFGTQQRRSPSFCADDPPQRSQLFGLPEDKLNLSPVIGLLRKAGGNHSLTRFINQSLRVPFHELTIRVMIGMPVGGDHAKGSVFTGSLLNLARPSDTGAVSMEEERKHHLGVTQKPARATSPIGAVFGG